MTTGLVHDALFLEHNTGPGHPERAARLAAIRERLETSGLLQELDAAAPSQAPIERLERVHVKGFPERIRAASSDAPCRLPDGDTVVSPGSWHAALAAAGGACDAVTRVVDGTWENAFVAARPPGHHAEADRAMGFCLFNNAAVAARHAQDSCGIARVAIVDWDVHHGNGTQHIFEHDPTVFYASLHQWPLYPGTGAASERGLGAGEGATLNCPQEPGSGDAQWIGAFETQVLPALEAFGPELVIVSAGFDAHVDDPLAGARVTTDGFERMTTLVRDFARASCQGRIVSLLEGGYDLDALAASVEAHLRAYRG